MASLTEEISNNLQINIEEDLNSLNNLNKTDNNKATITADNNIITPIATSSTITPTIAITTTINTSTNNTPLNNTSIPILSAESSFNSNKKEEQQEESSINSLTVPDTNNTTITTTSIIPVANSINISTATAAVVSSTIAVTNNLNSFDKNNINSTSNSNSNNINTETSNIIEIVETDINNLSLSDTKNISDNLDLFNSQTISITRSGINNIDCVDSFNSNGNTDNNIIKTSNSSSSSANNSRKNSDPRASEVLSAIENTFSSHDSMFSEVFENKNGETMKEETLEDSNPYSDRADKNCKICKGMLNSPRILSCLHVFCEMCIDKLLIDGTGDSLKKDCNFPCPTCGQITKVGQKGAVSLTCDYIFTNILDLSTIEPKMLACTSCKSKENAISRCNDCANFLCAGCDKAHKYMRCFENHEVVILEDLQKSAEKVTIHKPLFCNVHTSENLKYYCFNCQIPVCNDCLIADHKGSEHHYDIITNAEKNVRNDVENLLKEARAKVKYCDSAASELTSALNELQTQHDTARELIEEVYRNFKIVVERCRENSLTDLEKLHSERELKIMDLLHIVEKQIEKIEGVCKFTNRVLDQANAAEFLSMKKLIHSQFINLISNTPKCDVNYSLEFDSKFEKFEQLAQETFGKFRTESTPPSPKESTPPPTLPGMPPMMINHRNNGAANMVPNNSPNILNNGSSVTASSPISLPTSMQSSFDGDISALGNNYMLPNVLATPDSPPQSHMHHHNPQHPIHHQSMQNQPPPQHNSHHLQQHNNNNHHHNVHHHQHPLLGSGAGLTNGPGSGISGLGNNSLVGGPSSIGSNSSLNNAVNSLVPSMVGNSGATSTSTINGMGGFNSIAEYNLQRLASLTENTPDNLLQDSIVPNCPANTAVPPPNPHVTLAEIIAGDQRALNNFQALAKLGLNSTDLTANHHNLLAGARGSSPGMDLLNDFGLGSSTSPMPQLSSLGVGGEDLSMPNFQNIVPGRTKATPMQIRCKFGSLGTSKGQFNSPHGFCLGVDEEIIVADTNNHRIEVFEKNGTFKFQFGVPGKEEGQLWYPRKVAVMLTNGKFVVCDRGNERSRMQIFSKNGHFMKKIAIRYIDIVAGLAVTSKGQIVAVDSVSPTVFIISEDGDLVHWFDCSDYMREPSDIAIRDNDFYVCDFKGHCVAVFKDDGAFQYRIGNEKVTCFPNGIDISNAGDILIGDSHGNRFHVACYSRDGILQSEFECPHVKVSRCCGLKITSEGYVVTLAKNNHHVLVLNTLYVH
ncbi:brain tumor protein isoform X2 [Condylostylus longicornis]|uniref:brain tumor protein isoform X2 n=1 Tax=Condylostylus longicornis TaxID=2530218 RepID=UPI00244DB778|nr:brain tumor protein isoform X2 [Condylostylus longicornis]